MNPFSSSICGTHDPDVTSVVKEGCGISWLEQNDTQAPRGIYGRAL